MPYRYAGGQCPDSRGAWVDAALQALAEGGPDAVRIEALAVRLGVSKGGFYWHFADRQALLQEMLDAWEKAGTDDIIARVDSQPGDPRAKLRRLFQPTPPPGCRGAGDPGLVAPRQRGRRAGAPGRQPANGYMRSLFGQFCADENDVEARGMLAYSLVIGSYFIAAQHGDKTRSQVLQLASTACSGKDRTDRCRDRIPTDRFNYAVPHAA